MPFSSRTRHASVCGPNTTQPLQPDVAPCLATTPVVNYTRRCPGRPWSCCVTIVAFKFSALPFQGSPRTFFNSLIANLSSGGTRCNDLAFWTPFPVRMMCSPVIGALPTQIHGPISDPDCMLARLCTCTSLFLQMATLGSCMLSKKHAQMQFSRRFFTWDLVRLYAA